MLIEWAIYGADYIINALMLMSDALPQMPESVMNIINTMFDLLYSGIALASVFIDFNIIKILIPIVIAILNFDKIIKVIIFIIKKIPFLGIE